MKNLIALAGTAVLPLALVGCTSTATTPGDFPSGDLTIIVPFAPGGPTDTMARTVAAQMEEDLGATTLVVNKEGATGAVAMQSMLAEKPDGHTISVLATPGGVMNPLLLDVPFTNEDYRTVAAPMQMPALLAVGKGSDLTDPKGFFEHARKNPGKVKVAVVGSTASQALELQRMNDLYDVKLTAVPFNGNAEATTALLGGNVDAAFMPASAEMLQMVESGDVAPIAISSAERQDYLPDTPTLVELGFPELDDSVSTFGFVVPADTPDATVDRLEKTIEEALEQEDVRTKLDERYVPTQFIGADEFRTVVEDSVEAYETVAGDQ